MSSIREFREKNRVRLTELARASDITASYLSSIERGFARITSTAASKLVNGYKSLGFDELAASKTMYDAVEVATPKKPSHVKHKKMSRDQFFQAASVIFDVESDRDKFESLAIRLGLMEDRHDCPDCD
jgi:transcriptional regulator with XRE-family HTH domain